MPLCMTPMRWRSESHNSNWRPVYAAPCDRDLEVAVIDKSGVHVFTSPCRRILGYWCDARTMLPVEVEPTHWREETGRFFRSDPFLKLERNQ
jgi:hypothetical protein